MDKIILEEFELKKPFQLNNTPVPLMLLEQDLDIVNRVIYITSIDLLTASFVEQRAHCIYNMSGDHNTPITLAIESYGGDVYGMFGVINVIESLPTKVNTLCRGTAQSAAAAILMCGTGTRTMSKSSFIMIHQLSSWLGGQAEEIAIEAKHIKDLMALVYKLLTERSSKPVEFWKKQTRGNLYIPAQKCLEYGLIDVIK